ncbi:MAG TPA: MFS transporter [Thermomicrobiales bacterium]|nr:MFS transporter [Thermomicrobiales bacterium]
MYQIEGSGQVLRSRDKRARLRLTRPQVSQVVLMLGLTSMFTDISSEMVSSILPMYLVLNLHLSPFAFGVLDGIYLGGAAFVRLISGFLADKSRRHKEIAAAGYALSAVSRIGLLVVGGVWTLLASVILLDRLGKGIRSAPRDAMISLSTEPEKLGTAFGVHRAMDTAGAMIGPLIAFGLLTLTPDSYDTIFIVSLCFAVIGVGVISLFVQNPPNVAAKADEPAATPSLRAALSLARDARFGPLLIVGGALSLATMSDGFLYLTLQRRLDFNVGLFPLLYVATALVFMLLAIPMGQLADRFGRARIFFGGYAVLLAVYALLLLPWYGAAQVIVSLVLLGVYYAATDGVLMALASALLPEDLRTSGLALLTTVTNLGRLAASALFGLLWTWQGMSVAIWIFIVGLGVATLLTGWLFALPRHRGAARGI